MSGIFRTDIITILIGLLGAAVFVYMSGSDYEDALQEQQTYCANVHAGFWPDYNKNYHEVCDGNGNRKN